MGSIGKHFLGYLNFVEREAVLEALKHPGEVVRHFFGVEDARDVICQPLKSRAGVNKKLAIKAPILIDGRLAREVLRFLVLVLRH